LSEAAEDIEKIKPSSENKDRVSFQTTSNYFFFKRSDSDKASVEEPRQHSHQEVHGTLL
jgi:hypothetical protein